MLTSPTGLTPDSILALLAENHLLRGEAASIQSDPVVGQFGKSRSLFLLRVEYTHSAPPGRFCLKFGKSRKEVYFYQVIAPAMASQTSSPTPLLPRCHAAAYDPASDQYSLLLEDLSETHFQTDWPLPPANPLCLRTVETLAHFHARWWQHPLLADEFRAAIPPGRSWRDRRALALEKLPDFLAFLGDRLSAPRRHIYRRLAERWAGSPGSPVPPWEPPPGGPHQTLLHGDMHVWNVFYPRDPAGPLCFFDWNMWDTGCPADDLAYLMAAHWYPERRGRLEQDLLRAYHQALVGCGVSGYSADDLQQDYRAAVIRSLLIPAWQWVRGIQPGIWWSHLERIFLACEDLNCRGLD